MAVSSSENFPSMINEGIQILNGSGTFQRVACAKD